MPKVSKTSASRVQDIGVGEVREDVAGDYQISFLDLHEETDMAPLLKGLPDDLCPCPHWGYVLDGRLTFSFMDHEEVFDGGDAFYVGPGHSPSTTAGTQFILMSPVDEIAAVDAAIESNLAKLQST